MQEHKINLTADNPSFNLSPAYPKVAKLNTLLSQNDSMEMRGNILIWNSIPLLHIKASSHFLTKFNIFEGLEQIN